MAEFFFFLVVIAAIVVLLIRLLRNDSHYSEMTEEQFEEEAQKKTLIGSALSGLEVALRRKESEVMMESMSRIERDDTPSPGEPPEETTQTDNKNKPD